MKISELMNDLERLMWQEGDVDVIVKDYDRDYGIFYEDPEVSFVRGKVYLN